jgi:hypothetical protein
LYQLAAVEEIATKKVKNEQANDKDRLPGGARWWRYMVSRGKTTGQGLSC